MRPGVIAQLRDIVPLRPLTRVEALSIAERQALKLLEITGVVAAPVPARIVEDLPKVQVTRSKAMLHSGMSAWEHGGWRIMLNSNDSRLRQRFSLFHELKHVIDHPFVNQLYGAVDPHERDDWIESICDYFAGCALMPRPWLKQAWTTGSQRLPALAHRFDVSQAAMQTRLHQTGLAPATRRCSHRHARQTARARYYRNAPVPAT